MGASIHAGCSDLPSAPTFPSLFISRGGKATKSWETTPSCPALWCLVHLSVCTLSSSSGGSKISVGEWNKPRGQTHRAPKVGDVATNLRQRTKPCPDNLDLHPDVKPPHLAGTCHSCPSHRGCAEICAIPERGIGKMFIFLHRKMMTH